MKLTFQHEGLNYAGVTSEEALAAGVPVAIVEAEVNRVRTGAISAECRKRIYAVASAETQMNMAAASAVISSKAASARSEAEKAVLDGLEAAIGWVAAMRANVAMLAADPDKDFTADANWPAAPAEAEAIAHQF